MAQTTTKLEALLASLQDLADFNFESDADHRRAFIAARQATAKLASPIDRALETPGQVARDAIIKTCLELKLFQKWKDEGGKTMSGQELASMVGCDTALMDSFLKHLANNDVVDEVGPHAYASNAYTRALADPRIASCIHLSFDTVLPAFHLLPNFLAEHDYKRPTDNIDTATRAALGYDGTFFEGWVSQKPERQEQFGLWMAGLAANRPSWADVYPIEERLLAGTDHNGTLVVDIGGNLGHDLQSLLWHYPSTAGRVVLQDQPHVIEEARKHLTPTIRAQPHDFFATQPIKAARAYYLHQILHDWPDDMAIKILSCIAPAMKSGYSKILLHENIVESEGADSQMTTFDMLMMLLFGGKERTFEDFERLAKGAGLRICEIYGEGVSVERVIELELI